MIREEVYTLYLEIEKLKEIVDNIEGELSSGEI